jgi:hypothetical protein
MGVAYKEFDHTQSFGVLFESLIEEKCGEPVP